MSFIYIFIYTFILGTTIFFFFLTFCNMHIIFKINKKGEKIMRYNIAKSVGGYALFYTQKNRYCFLLAFPIHSLFLYNSENKNNKCAFLVFSISSKKIFASDFKDCKGREHIQT